MTKLSKRFLSHEHTTGGQHEVGEMVNVGGVCVARASERPVEGATIQRGARGEADQRFGPKNPQQCYLRDGSDGCVRATKLNCVGDGFLVLKNMKLPESAAAAVDGGMSIEEARLAGKTARARLMEVCTSGEGGRGT